MNTIKKISVMLLACLLSLTLFSCTNDTPNPGNTEPTKEEMFAEGMKALADMGFSGEYKMYNAKNEGTYRDPEFVKDTSITSESVGTLSASEDNVTYSVGINTGEHDFDLKKLAMAALEKVDIFTKESGARIPGVSFTMIDNSKYDFNNYETYYVFDLKTSTNNIVEHVYYILEK